jgi:hypothetical protein
LRTVLAAAVIVALLAPAGSLAGQDRVYARNGSGVYGYKDTPRLPWCEWLCHDPDRPAPSRVDPGPSTAPAPVPSDARVLFDGSSVAMWKQSPDWKVVDGFLVAGSSMFSTLESFGAVQLHLEFMTPEGFQGPWYNQGNNGVFLMGLYEIQIFDSFNEKIYPDGQCAAIYGQTPPLSNASRAPGRWQSLDIVFHPALFETDRLRSPARVTVFHNGVLAQLNEEIHGETGHRIAPEYKTRVSRGPLSLGGHGCPVRFRNIWLRPL